jgi:aminotransferase
MQEHGVTLDPVTQILAVSGASVGIGLTIQTLINPGELV